MTVRVLRRPRPYGSRFGGGWEWKLGVQATKRFETVIVSLVLMDVRITR